MRTVVLCKTLNFLPLMFFCPYSAYIYTLIVSPSPINSVLHVYVCLCIRYCTFLLNKTGLGLTKSFIQQNPKELRTTTLAFNMKRPFSNWRLQMLILYLHLFAAISLKHTVSLTVAI